MSDTKDEGGFVYPPSIIKMQHGPSIYEQGMTRRDWLAGLAMQGMIAHPEWDIGKDKVSQHAYYFADAMIAEGKKNG